MKKYVTRLGLSIVFSMPLGAQESYPKVEIPLVFSYASLDSPVLGSRKNSSGAGVSVSFNFHRNFGFTAEIMAESDSRCGFCLEELRRALAADSSSHFESIQYLFGPRSTLRRGRTTLFAHALFGGLRTTFTQRILSTMTETKMVDGPDFAIGLGGGLDIPFGRRWAFRAFQFDYIPVYADPVGGKNFRLLVGVVFLARSTETGK